MKEDQQEVKKPEIPTQQEQLLLESVPLIKKIATRKLNPFYPSAAEDIVQKVFLKLWRWMEKKESPDLDKESWHKLANTATQNEISSFYSHKSNKEVLLDEDLEVVSKTTSDLIEGNTEKEIGSLAAFAWNEIRALSLRQKYALLLQKQELIFYLVSSQCCQAEEIAEHLQLSKKRFLEIFQLLPLSDEEISDVFFETTNLRLTAKQVWETRSKARIKLNKVLR